MRRNRRIWIGLLLGGGFVLLLAFWFAKPLLYVETAAPRGEVIVVLGGDVTDRVWRGLELYKAGVAPRILLSGSGDNAFVRRRLVLAGVPEQVITEEGQSRNTRENAEFSVRWMRQEKLHRAVIVTTWWHSRRAMASFRKFGPDLEFASAPSYDAPTMEDKPALREAISILQEYAKLLGYPVRHGIWAF